MKKYILKMLRLWCQRVGVVSHKQNLNISQWILTSEL